MKRSGEQIAIDVSQLFSRRHGLTLIKMMGVIKLEEKDNQPLVNKASPRVIIASLGRNRPSFPEVLFFPTNIL